MTKYPYLKVLRVFLKQKGLFEIYNRELKRQGKINLNSPHHMPNIEESLKNCVGFDGQYSTFHWSEAEDTTKMGFYEWSALNIEFEGLKVLLIDKGVLGNENIQTNSRW